MSASLIALAGLALIVPPAGARGDERAPGAARDERHPLTLDEAVALVARRYSARVVRAEEAKQGEEVVYRIRLLAQDGRVFTVTVNAQSGAAE